MDELLRVAKTRPNSSLRAAGLSAIGGGGLVREVEAAGLDDHQTAKDEGGGTPPPRPAYSSLCAICRGRESAYTCPQCNVPYCSLTCFRAPRHAACAEPFQRQTLRGELGAGEGEGPGRVDEEERKRMMDVLRRMRELGGEGEEQEEEGGADRTGTLSIDDAAQRLERLGIDVHTAGSAELWSFLTPAQRADFQRQLRATEEASARMASRGTREEMVRGERTLDLDEQSLGDDPWWISDNGALSVQSDTGPFLDQVKAIEDTIATDRVADLRYNIIAVVIVYVYVVRHFRVARLTNLCKGGGLENTGEREAAKELLNRALPFLCNKYRGDLLFGDLEEVTLATIARLELTEDSAKAMVFLLRDAVQVAKKPKVVATDTIGKITTLLDDLSHLLSKYGRKKALFYAAYWSKVMQDGQDVEIAIEAEIERLESEIERAVDEERFFAANEAIRQHDKVVLS